VSTLAKGDSNPDMDVAGTSPLGPLPAKTSQPHLLREVNSITPIGLAARHDFCSGYPRTFMIGTSAGCLTVASCA
jgi:hypothetical protein